MKKRFIAVVSIVLSLCFLFLTGCNVEKTNTENSTDTSSESLESETALTTTEEALDETTEIETEKESENSVSVPSTVAPTKPVKVPATVVTIPETLPAPVKKDVDSYKWNPAGVYEVGNGKNMLVPGEYYVERTSSKEASIGMVNYKSARRLDGTSYLVNLNAGDKVYLIECKIIHSSVKHPHADSSGKYQPGIYKIGRDIPAGEYILRQTSTYSRFDLVSNSNIRGEYDDLRGRVKNFSYITLKEGSYIKLDRCTLEPKTSSPVVKPSDNIYPNGMYLVGKDLPAGEYIARPITDNASVSFYSSSAYPSPAPVKTVKLKKNKESLIVLEAGQYVVTDNATLEKHGIF